MIDFAREAVCRRCGVSLYEATQSTTKNQANAPQRKIPVVSIAIAAAVAFVLYTYFGAKPTEPVNMKAAVPATSQPQPQPTLSARAEHEQRMTGSYKTALQNSPALAESQKRLEETQKLMQNEPAKAH